MTENQKQDLQIKMVDPKEIYLIYGDDGYPINPRGPVTDTTDLQQSISAAGRIIQPLTVIEMPLPGGDDESEPELALHVVNGHRRLTAARALKLSKVPVRIIELRPGEDVVDLMFATDVTKKFPPVVLDGDGVIIGGIAKAVARKIDGGTKTLKEIGDIMGLRADEVSAYQRLFYAPVEVRQAVAKGRLSISAFARMKHASSELQREIVNSAEDADTVSVDRVRRHLKKHKSKNRQSLLGEDMVEAATVTEATTDQDGEIIEAQEDRPDTVLVALNRIYRALKSVDPAGLGGRERYVWDQIVDLMLDSVVTDEDQENQNQEVMK